MLGLLLAAAFWPNLASAQLPTIELHGLSPAVGQAGTTVALEFRGTRIDELQEVLFSGEGLSASPRTGPPRVLSDQPTPTNQFDVAIAQDAAPGLTEVWAVGRFGLSNPRRFLVTAKPVHQASGGHTTVESALPLSGNEIVLDHCAPQNFNFYQVTLAAGTKLQAAAYSQPLDSRAAVVLKLMDAGGKELGRGYSTGPWPAEIDYVSQDSADVFLVVHDLLYQGGPDFSFVLEAAVGDQESAHPALELNRHLRPQAPSVPAEGEPTPAEQTSGTILQPPFAIEGNFAQGPVDFDFTAAASQQLSLRVTSASAGQLTDPRIVVYRRQGDPEMEPTFAQLAEQDDLPPLGRPDMRVRQLDPALVWTAPEEGTYRVSIRDNQSGDRPTDAQRFRLTVGEPSPGFRLLAYRPLPHNNPAVSRPFGSNLVRGGSEAVYVLAIREDGYAGPITVSIKDPPPGLTCQEMIIPAGQNEAALILQAEEEAPAWHGELSVVGRGEIGDQVIEATADAATIVWPAIPTKNAVQHRSADRLMATINAADVAPVSVELGDASVTEVKQGETASVPIKANRREGSKAEIVLRPQHLPPQATLGELRIPEEQTELTAELAIAADAPPGEYTWWMQGETKVSFRPNPQALQREEAYLASLQEAAEAATDEEVKKPITEAITAVTAAIETLKQQTAEQDFTVWLPTTPHRIRIVEK